MTAAEESLILAIDTSGSFCSVATRSTDGRLAHRTTEGAGDHFERLPSLVAEVFQEVGRSVGSLTEVRIGLGPGSFTGLRIGMSFAKGLAVASRASLYGVSSFLAAAHDFSRRANGVSEVAVVADARRNEAFFQIFELCLGSVKPRASAVIAPVEEVRSWAKGTARRVITPSRGFSISDVEMVEISEISKGILEVECPVAGFSMERIALLEPDYIRAVSAKSIEERLRG